MADPPWHIGPYEILGTLGQGGMGVVYRARERTSGREVALKTLKAVKASMLAGLRREIGALQRLQHPGIVRILDTGFDEAPWYTMNLVQGRPLNWYFDRPTESDPLDSFGQTGDVNQAPVAMGWWTQSLVAAAPLLGKQGPFTKEMGSATIPEVSQFAEAEAPVTDRLIVAATLEMDDEAFRRRLSTVTTLVARLCEALAYLHGEGVVHCDLKPSNVVVTGELHPVLMDFGLATRHAGTGRDSLERGHSGAGTIAYMAPEQITGQPLDARADLYALGCLLYEMVVGHVPFDDRSPITAIRQHLDTAPMPVIELEPRVPIGLNRLITRLLAKEPNQRFGYAEDVARRLHDLGGIASGNTQAPRPRAYLYRSRLAGREQARTELQQAITKGVAGGGSLVLVGGANGAGKTRLVSDLLREQEGADVMSGQCTTVGTGDATVRPVLESVRPSLLRMADHCAERGPDETERVFGPYHGMLANLEPGLAIAPRATPVLDANALSAKAGRQVLVAGLTHAFEAWSSRQTTILALDDLQWVDELVMQWLKNLVDQKPLEGQAFMVIGTFRADDADGLRELIESGVPCVQLARLDEGDIRRMVGDMLAMTSPPEALVHATSEYASGTPLLVAEYLYGAMASGTLHRDKEGAWRFDADRVPRSQGEDEHGLTIRLDHLGDKVRTTARAAAVIGRDAPLELLRDVMGFDDVSLYIAIAELERVHVIEAYDPAGDAASVRFVHDQVREGLLAKMPHKQKVMFHGRVAAALEHAGPDGMAARAGHLEQSGATSEAATCYLQAAEAALERFAWQEAGTHFERYLVLQTEPSAERAIALRMLGNDVHFEMGRFRKAEECLNQAIAVAKQIADAGEEGRSRRFKARVLRHDSRVEEASIELARARTLLEKTGDRFWRAVTLADLGAVRLRQQKFELAEALNREAIAELDGLGATRERAGAMADLATILKRQGKGDEAYRMMVTTLDLNRQIKNIDGEMVALMNLGLQARQNSAYKVAGEYYDQALELARKWQQDRRLLEALHLRATLSLYRGELEHTRTLLNEVKVRAFKQRSFAHQTRVRVNLGCLAKVEGKWEEGRVLLEEAVERHRIGANQLLLRLALGLLLEVLTGAGDVEGFERVSTRLKAVRSAADPSLSAFEIHCLVEGERLLGTDIDPVDLDLRMKRARELLAGSREERGLIVQLGSVHVALLRRSVSEARALYDQVKLACQSIDVLETSELMTRLRRAEQAIIAARTNKPMYRGDAMSALSDGLKRHVALTSEQ